VDARGNPHVLSVGIDLGPALESQGFNAADIAHELAEACRSGGGQAEIAAEHQQAISQTAGVLNIRGLGRSLTNPVKVICPRPNRCDSRKAVPQHLGLDALRQQVLAHHGT
jgi:hypothetical protein